VEMEVSEEREEKEREMGSIFLNVEKEGRHPQTSSFPLYPFKLVTVPARGAEGSARVASRRWRTCAQACCRSARALKGGESAKVAFKRKSSSMKESKAKN